MNQKKAKALRRVARQFVIQSGKPIHTIDNEYKQLKKVYKISKGQR